jgi:transketolase
MVPAAMEAAATLESEGIQARVLNMCSVKPIDAQAVVAAAGETGAIVTAEEHSVIGGLGSAVAEVVCETTPVPVFKVGIQDTFGRSGEAGELMEKYGLTAASVAEAARKAMAGKVGVT